MDTTLILMNIRRIVRSIHIESKQIQKLYGVSIPQVLCLDYLNQSPDFTVSQKDLKNYLNLNASTVSGIVQRLEAKGLIAKISKGGDKRITHWILTATGARLLATIPRLLHQQLAMKLAELPQNQVVEIQNSLEKLTHMLKIEKLDASPIITTDLE